MKTAIAYLVALGIMLAIASMLGKCIVSSFERTVSAQNKILSEALQ